MKSFCNHCLKPHALCLCEAFESLPCHLPVVILQHPRERRESLGTARLIKLGMSNTAIANGLSWRNLASLLENAPIDTSINPRDWMVLYAGSRKESTPRMLKPGLYVRQRGGVLGPAENIRGLILLDGNWAQAKTLWWRNPWLLKLQRGILIPAERTKYRFLKRGPRRECVSTLEAAAWSLKFLGCEKQSEHLMNIFGEFLIRTRQPEEVAKT